jgi:type IV pilus assembly protein PilF
MRIRLYLLFLLIPLLSACITVDSGPADNEKASAINVQLGMGYLQQNKLELANEKLVKALRQNPKSASAHNAYAILQDRLLIKDKAAFHYKKATSLDPKDSQAANNYGTFLCRNNEEEKSEKYFLRALKNPLYKTPEFAYTNAALCLIRINERDRAISYLNKALAANSNFPVALVTMAKISFEDQNFRNAKLYVDRYHLVARPSSKSLWLSIRTELMLDTNQDVDELADQLQTNFPESEEYQSWLAIEK